MSQISDGPMRQSKIYKIESIKKQTKISRLRSEFIHISIRKTYLEQ